MNDMQEVIRRGSVSAILLVGGCTVSRLDLSDGPARMAIVQRTSAAIPGSEGTIKVQAEDVTEGQVLLHVRGAAGEKIVDVRSCREGDVIPLPLRSGTYDMRITKLHNMLVGDDFVELEISERKPARAAP